MDLKERQLLNIMQNGIPIVSRPFEAIGEELNMTEADVLKMIEGLKDKGFIRRFGGIVNIAEVGVASTLVGLKVDEGNVASVAERVNELTGVTHNYQRDDAFNLWFTLMESDKNTLHKHIEDIRAMDDVQSLISLPSKKKYKTKVILEV